MRRIHKRRKTNASHKINLKVLLLESFLDFYEEKKVCFFK